MELPPDDGGLDLGDAPPLPDGVPDEGQELPGLPDDDISGDVFGDHLADQEWLEKESGGYLSGGLPGLPADDFGGMDICEVCEAVVALPDDIVRLTCACQHKCVERVMQAAAPVVRHLRDEVRDKGFLLELVKHAHLATVSSTSRRGRSRMWKIAGHSVCVDAFTVLLGIGKKKKVRGLKIMKSVRASGICP